MIRNLFIVSFSIFFFTGCAGSGSGDSKLLLGAEQKEVYLPLLKDKAVGLLVNHTSRVADAHLIDILLKEGVQVKAVFAPEHGFRGTADAGEKVQNGVDEKTGIPVFSVYGKTRKPAPEMLRGLDVVIFDIQDVGARFYTYISSMHYMMEACAEQGISMVVFDRPNPNGRYIDGPVLEPEFRSFVGMHPIPVVHGLTVGELAQMINGEGWLSDGLKCRLTVVPMKNYRHSDPYSLPVKPSPNLPNDQAVALYPSLCFFEGTKMSVGRGTPFPFQVVGYPDPRFGEFTFTPQSIEGMAKHPKLEGQQCYGVDLRNAPKPDKIDLSHLIRFYNLWNKDEPFFNNYFEKLAGTATLRRQIEKGLPEAEIRANWQPGLDDYKKLRRKYLLYED